MIVVGGTKGAPGATTTALLLASLLSDAVLVEADPDGGVLSLRLAGPSGQVLPASPSIAQLAVESAELTRDGIYACALDTAVGVPVVCAVAAARSMHQTVSRHGRALAEGMARLDNVVVDVGRFAPASPAGQFMAAASVVVLVASDDVASFFYARDACASILSMPTDRRDGSRLALATVVVASARRGAAAESELATAMTQRGLPVASAGWIARDEKGLSRWIVGDRSAGRSVLLRTARPVAESVSAIRDRKLVESVAETRVAPPGIAPVHAGGREL